MTAVNAGIHELAGVRLPLQPYPGGHAVFMYSTASDGNVTLQLKEPDDLDKNSLAAMLAKLQDDATFSISYQDTDILSEGIDVLLGTGPANSGGSDAVTATFDLFDSSSGPDLTLSPQTFTNSAEAFINDNSNSLGVPTESDAVSTTTTDDKKSLTTSELVKVSTKRARPKPTSPNRQGPQQCQVCAKVFGNASALAKHKLTHSDERKYVCSMCGKAFKRQDHLNGHMLTHRNKKPYECKAEGCGKSYCDARSLRRHTENHHSTPATTVNTTTTTLSPAQGAASGDAASPHGSSCIQYAPPPTSNTASTTTSVTASNGKSQLQQLLATDSTKGSNSTNNDGLTKQQLDLIHQIMEQTQRQSQAVAAAAAAAAAASNKSTSSKTSSSGSGNIKSVGSSKSTSKSHQSKNTWLPTACHQQHTNKSSSSSSSSSTSGTPSPQAKVTTSSTPTSPINSTAGKTEPKPVECNLCHRKFKNIPALNGHMRLHGGYFKKVGKMDTENKKSEKKDPGGPPLQTASFSVRALIEEKIINKRITNTPQPSNDDQKINAPPLFPLNVHSSPSNNTDLESKISSFVVPAPPQQTSDKSRRHSDAETFRSSTTQQEAQALADLILKREKATVKRTTSDPGQSSPILQFQSNDSFTLANVTYQSEEAEFISSSLQEGVFTQVQDSMLLQGVDPNQLASIQFQAESLLQDHNEPQMQDFKIEDINLQESVVQHSPSYQSNHSVNQDLQAVLDSPLPESLAEFSTFHSTNSIDMPSPSYQTQSPAQYARSPHTITAQSPLQSPLIRHDSPGFAYPTPPASHEGQSPGFGQNTILPMVSPNAQEFGQIVDRGVYEEPPQASSPLSAAFFTSTMSSSAAVEEALEEVLPGEPIYPLTNSPSPQSPLGLTPVPSPISNTVSTSDPQPSTKFSTSPNTSTYSMSGNWCNGVMLPNSDDPLLSSSPKDFVPRRKIEINGVPLRLISNNGLIELNSSNFAGILVDANGEIKLFQTGGSTFQTKNILLTNTPLINTQDNDDKCKKVIKTVQCTIPTKHVINKPKQMTEIKKEDNNDVFLSPTSIPASPVRISRKRPRTEPLQLPVLHQSKLRATRSKPPGCARYTPQPILSPQRPGTGLYTNIKNRNDDGMNWNSDPIPESDSTPHVNVGSQFQCKIPSFSSAPNRGSSESTYEDLLWDPGISNCTDSEVDMYLDFACCAAVPGGGRNKEYAMHLLHMCGGNIHDAMLRLMQPSPNLPTDHPLLAYQYCESDKWSTTETDIFHKSLLKYDKDFRNIAQEIRTKTIKQCVQFYYVWKKVCADEYRRLKHLRERRNYYYKHTEMDMDEKLFADVKLLGIADSGCPMPIPDTRNFVCEFPDCSASFNSRAALNGHIRIHGGTARNSPTPSSTTTERRTVSVTSSTMCHPDSTEEYPCKICGKVFTKIKSRSAHMKSHRPPDAEPVKRKEKDTPSYELSVPSPFST
ncbi:mucin-5AC isoform X3 [Diorhabda carinulata]|nr:mucin-5AC isoform X3 [Diorhabda carinulata]XP_057664131.1 mucin-5AC isoform X3 [Diorhabda carinulata]XP_057664139.1 mucin-5AC isoform X3 [Diorhabda carinulata]